MKYIPSNLDNFLLGQIRDNVQMAYKTTSQSRDHHHEQLLDIGSSGEIFSHFHNATIHTLDIDACKNPTYVCDICCSDSIKSIRSKYDVIFMMEVLEHVSNPFKAVSNLRLITKPGGLLVLSSPLNFRIHGPLPDYWRFTEYGLRELLKNWTILNLRIYETSGRPLMPYHHVCYAINP